MAIEDIDSVVARESEGTADEGRLACARALGVARRLGVAPGEIGDAANRLGVRIVDCQLGCFGSKKATHDDLDDAPIPQALAAEITASLVDGRLPCPAAFEVAKQLKIPPSQVGDAATKQQVKISGCQLGCFP
jgi:hypothetical protein